MFGQRLRIERLNRGLTQEELGKLVNKSKNNISQYETGKREPDLQTLNKFAEIFNCTVDYLLGRTEQRNTAIIEGERLPKELRDVGVEYLVVAKEMQDKEIPPEDIRKIIDIIKKHEK